MMPWGGNRTACWEEPHCRSMVVAGTSSGSPAASQALRATLTDCSPSWDTQPMSTSSTSSGSTPLRSTRARSTTAPRSTACPPASPPFRRPTGVRTAPTTTGSSPGSRPAPLPAPSPRARASMSCPFPRSPPPKVAPPTAPRQPAPDVPEPPGPRDPRGAGGLPALLDGDALEAEVLDRAVHGVAVDGGHGVDHLHALDDLAEDGVLAVEPGCRGLGDEELGPVGVGAGVGHGQVAGAVEAVGAADLVLELVAGAATAGPERVAALDHEVGDDPVEDRPLVERPLLLGAGGRVPPRLGPGRQADEVLDRLGGGVGEQADPDGPLGGLQGRVGVGHGRLLAVGAGARIATSSGRWPPYRTWPDGSSRRPQPPAVTISSRERRRSDARSHPCRDRAGGCSGQELSREGDRHAARPDPCHHQSRRRRAGAGGRARRRPVHSDPRRRPGREA